MVTMFNRNDLTKQGKMKKRNNAKAFNEDDFIKYAKENNISGKTRYIDSIADLSNGMLIKCDSGSPHNIIVGTTTIINSINN